MIDKILKIKIQEMIDKILKIKIQEKIYFYIFCIFSFLILSLSNTASADVLLPGNISTCGELASPGTYTVTQNISGGSNTCFFIGSDGVIINGGGFTITGTGDVAIDARARTGGPTGSLTVGAHAYTNLIINDLNISGYTTGLNISGNDDEMGTGVNNGYAGDAGDVAIYYSYIGSIISNGGFSSNKSFGGVGGNISFNDTTLNISSSTISALGGGGIDGSNTNGGLSIVYTTSLNTNNLTLSGLSYISINGSSYNNFSGGTWPIFPGNVSSCGTLFGSGTYTLTQDLFSSSTCFNISSDNVFINGANRTLSLLNSSSTDFAINVGTHSGFTLASTTVSGFSNLIIASSTVTISDDDLDISNKYINVGSLIVNYINSINTVNTTLSALSTFSINGNSYNNFAGGTWPIFPGNVSSCGTLFGSGTYTLTQDLFSSSTCFNISSNNIIINGNGYSINSATSTNEDFAINVGSYSGFTLASTTVNVFSKLLNASTSVTILGHNIDLSFKYINALGLTLNYTGLFNRIGLTSGIIDTILVNGLSYGNTQGGELLSLMRLEGSYPYNWSAFDSSADGTKLIAAVAGGYIYTSTDGGSTWATSTSAGGRMWNSVASSADGTKLAAVVSNGKIYTSNDSGNTWTERATSLGNRSWQRISSSANGKKLIASVMWGGVYVSNDYGENWALISSLGNKRWYGITISANGDKMIAADFDGLIYVSSDDGLNWTSASAGSYTWSVTSSADGSKMYVASGGGYIYKSTDSGATWAPQGLSKNWTSISTSASGDVVYGVVNGDSMYKTINAGADWQPINGSNKSWSIVETNLGGDRAYGIITNTKIWKYESSYISNYIDIYNPVNGENINGWNPYVVWGLSTTCEYSFDNWSTSNVVNCSNNGNDIPNPGYGTHTLYVRGTDSANNILEKNSNFVYGLPIVVSSPISASTTTSWVPSVDWDPLDSGNITTCLYSYDNWSSTSTAACNSSGADILPPNNTGTTTLSFKVFNSTGDYGAASVNFTYNVNPWFSRDSIRNWFDITSSADGTKLAAAAYGGYIYTSTDSGITWTPQTSSGSRNWYGLSSSVDGTKLAAVVNGGQIYTSTTSGATWVARDSNRSWISIASSDDGTKLAATVGAGYIYTSTTSGATWVAKTSSGIRSWKKIASSADGTKLAAVVWSGHIYTSSDSGNTWATSTLSIGTKNWWGITMTADGQHLAAVQQYGGNIYTSDDFGVTWNARQSIAAAYAISYSADGSKLIAAVGGDAGTGPIYVSSDYGVTWTTQESNRKWYAVTSSADGTKLAAVHYGGKIYTSTNGISSSVSIIRPGSESSILARAWSALVNWGSSVSCYYSYNNWISSSTANCASAGSDILKPLTDGLTTLYVRGIDAISNQYNQASTFDFEPWTARDSGRSWLNIDASFDGKNMVAAAQYNKIYTSTTSGATWTTNSYIKDWRDVSMSVDGTKLIAVSATPLTAGYGVITYSTTSGATWATSTIPAARDWTTVDSSDSGQYAIAGAFANYIHISSDYGATWVAKTAPGSPQWYASAISSDGSVMAAAAAVGGSAIWVSRDYGSTWISTSTSRAYQSMAMSANGNLIVAVPASNAQPQFGTFSNGSWTWVSKGPVGSWFGVDVSPDGTKIVITSTTGYVYLSEDSGNTWLTKGTYKNWRGVKFIGNTNKYAAVVNGGQIYNSFSTPYIIAPVNGTTTSSWYPNISWDRSVTCEYSFDNTSWNNASCSGTGSDISAPTSSGIKTLYIKATDFEGGISTSSVSFDYFATISNNSSISSCGNITSAGTYTLTQDITNVSGVCLNINSNNVIIDGAGHTISAAPGNNNYAVIAGSSQNLKLQNINFSGFTTGNVSSNSSVEYAGLDIDLSNSTTTASSLKINYTNTLNTINSYLSSLSSLIINGVDLWSFTTAGLLSWSQQDISSCITISEPGYYRLTQDISNISGTCFDIQSKYVIIDGDNHTITSSIGNNNFAFVSRNTYDTTNKTGGIGIKNITVVGFGGGVDSRSASVDLDYINQFGDVDAVPGVSISLYNVNFPTNTVSVNTSGGDGFWNTNTSIIHSGGSAGSLKVSNSVLGSVIMNGGDTVIPQNIGSDHGSHNGGLKGVLTQSDSTISSITATDGSSSIPGCMDSDYFNYNSNATYNDGSCSGGTIGIDVDNPSGNTVNGETYFYTHSNYGTIIGDAYYYDHDPDVTHYGASYNYGTTTGTAFFVSWGYGAGNYGYVGNGAYLSSNYGTTTGSANNESDGVIDGDVYFESNSYNYGTINGNVYFNSYYAGSNYGTINGNVDFSAGLTVAGNYNYGTVNGDATFYYVYENQGVVNGIATYYYGCTDPSASNYDATAVVINSDYGYCEYVGSLQDNWGTVRGPITFTNGYNNYGTVNGDAVFESGSYNYDTVNGTSTFNNTYNYSTVNGNAIFNNSYNNGSVYGDAYFSTIDSFGTGKLFIDGSNGLDPYSFSNITGKIYDVNNYLVDTFEFTQGYANYANLNMNTIFDSGSNNYANLNGNATFKDTSENNGTIFGDHIIFEGSSVNTNSGQLLSTNTIIFNDNSVNQGTINADVKFNTYGYGINLPSNGTLTLHNRNWLGSINGSIYGSDDSLITNYEFYNYTVNQAGVNGNAVFHDHSHNAADVSGNVTFDTDHYGSTPTSTVMYIYNDNLNGNISGNIFSSDGVTKITDFVFSGYANNESAIVANAVFYDSSSNNGAITGNVVFNNTSPFTIGAVYGNVTLNGTAQTIRGAGSVENLTKNSNVRDVLYFDYNSGASLSVNGLLTLTGSDSSNLLTIRSTTPGAYINFYLNGDENLNFVRLKDIHNNSSLVDLSNNVAFDDTGNSGFTFPSNSTPGQRNAITISYTPPSLPPSRIVTPPSNPSTANNNPVVSAPISGISLDNFINPTIKPLIFKPTQNFNILNNANIGSTIIPNPLAGFKAPTTIDFIQLPVNFLTNVSKFVLNSVSSKNNKNLYSNNLNSYLSDKGLNITRDQDLAKLKVKPLSVDYDENRLMTDLFKVNSSANRLNTNLTYDNGLKSLIQNIRIPTNTYITLGSDKVKNITYIGKNFTVNKNIDVLTPDKPGRYIITSTNIPFVMDVFEQKTDIGTQTVKKGGLLNWFKNLFR